MASTLLVLFAVIAFGLLLGQVRLGGLSLGASGVIFTALLAGHFGYAIPGGMGPLGLVLFIYGVGLTAGPGFFRAFQQHGKQLAVVAVALVSAGGLATIGFARMLGLPADLAAGMFAGALTSTPALAAAFQALPEGSQAAVGYGIAYPFGVVGVVLFVQLLPRILKLDLDQIDEEADSDDAARREIKHVLVVIANPAVDGRRLTELELIAESNCQVTRVMEDNRLVPVGRDFTLEAGQTVLLIGRAFRLPPVVALLGRESLSKDYVLDTEHVTKRVVATSREVVGKSLRELSLRSRFGVSIARIERHEVQFVPDPDDVIHWGDALHMVAEPDALNAFATFAGHREHAFDSTDLVSISLGIGAGLLLGNVSFGLAGQEFQLGIVGGPMIVALMASHFGGIGRITASVPRASRMLMLEMGLVLFLADAGIAAGVGLADALAAHGWRLALAATGVVIVPITVGMLVARKVFDIDFLRAMGGVCGGMTSTPGVGALTASTTSQLPVAAYAVAYPVALILMTLVGRLLVGVL